MNNEILLVLSLVITYLLVLIWLLFFGKKGLYCFTVFATIAANIEVMILVDAFSIEQTLGNVLFASTFLVTDILHEIGTKKEANKAVLIGILTSVCFMLLSQSWLLYRPSPNDIVYDGIATVFKNTPRLMLSSLAVYAISQFFDVWLYQKWWRLTEKITGERKKGLWIRNNFSTLFSQLLNTVLFNFFAFYGIYDMGTLWSIIGSCYLIFIVTSLADTPVVYAARYIYNRKFRALGADADC